MYMPVIQGTERGPISSSSLWQIKLIRWVSDQCFVQTAPSSDAPLGLLHVQFDAKKQFQCICHKLRRVTSLCAATTAPKVSKHIYVCGQCFQINCWRVNFSMCLQDHGIQLGIEINELSIAYIWLMDTASAVHNRSLSYIPKTIIGYLLVCFIEKIAAPI